MEITATTTSKRVASIFRVVVILCIAIHMEQESAG